MLIFRSDQRKQTGGCENFWCLLTLLASARGARRRLGRQDFGFHLASGVRQFVATAPFR